MNTSDPSGTEAIPDSDDYASTLRRSFAWRYSQGQDVWSGEAALHEAAAWVFGHLPEGGQLLDIGFGSGANVQSVLAAGHAVTGIDIVAPANWGELRARWGSRLTLIEADFLSWEREPGGFDLVSDLGCLHHQQPENYLPYLRKIGRLLRGDGRLGLCVYEEAVEVADVGRMQTTDHGRLAKNFTEAELARLLDAAGFDILESHRTGRAAGLPPYLTVVAGWRGEIGSP